MKKEELPEWTEFNEESLIKNGNVLISIPCSHDEYNALSGCLKIVRRNGYMHG